MDVKTQKLIIGLLTVSLLAYGVVNLSGSRGVSFDVVNEYGQPLPYATCVINPDNSWGLTSIEDTTNGAGYCVLETPNYPDDLYDWVVWCDAEAHWKRGTVTVNSLGIKNFDVTLTGCSGQQQPTTTTIPGCTQNGGYVGYSHECCSGCISQTPVNGQYQCKACTTVTTTQSPVTTSPTTQPPTNCLSPYGNSGKVVCDGDVKKRCDCGVTCAWNVIGVCNGGDETTTTTMPPTGGCSNPYGSQGAVICSALDELTCNCYGGVCGWYRTGACSGGTTTTTQPGGDGGGTPDLTVILVVGGIGLAGIIYVMRRKR